METNNYARGSQIAVCGIVRRVIYFCYKFSDVRDSVPEYFVMRLLLFAIIRGMKRHHLCCIYEVVHHGSGVYAAAEALHTGQSGVSKQIQLLKIKFRFEISRKFRESYNRRIGRRRSDDP